MGGGGYHIYIYMCIYKYIHTYIIHLSMYSFIHFYYQYIFPRVRFCVTRPGATSSSAGSVGTRVTVFRCLDEPDVLVTNVQVHAAVRVKCVATQRRL